MTEKQPTTWAATALRYLDALDAGDAGALADLWEQASANPELERVLSELTDGLAAEEGASFWQEDAARVRTLLSEHLPSAFTLSADPPPLTIRDVAARLQSDSALGARLTSADRLANAQLLADSTPVPDELGLPQFEKWQATLGIRASGHYWRSFRQAAVLLTMGRCQRTAQLAAARTAARAPKGGNA